MNPYDKARELAAALKSAPEVVKFHEAKKALDEHESSKKMVEDFELKRLELQKKQLVGDEISEEDTSKVQELYNILALDKIALNYLNAEHQLSVIMQEISQIISDAVMA